jgi:MOSC domain-containing protein YiiM
MVRRFLKSGRYDWYFAVVVKGEVGAGNMMMRVHHDPDKITVADIARLYIDKRHNIALMQRAIEHQGLLSGSCEREEASEAHIV